MELKTIGGKLKKEDWENAYKAIHKTTNSRYWREDIHMVCFMRTEIQSKFVVSIKPGCWRSCGEKFANYCHVFSSAHQ